MKFLITKTSNSNYTEEKEINSLKELLQFVKENGNIVLQENDFEEISNSEFEIEIYDGYRE